jgi:endonuclease YncB( thermonuclease family)
VLAGLWLVACQPGEGGASRSPLSARAVEVLDGDSFVADVSGEGRTEVRLAGIDAPERGQAFSDRARRSLGSLVRGERLELVVTDVDRYGRLVARVYRGRDGLELNAEQVRSGHAWVYRRYVRDSELDRLEHEARAARRGLWRDARPEPPWKWRERQRRERR